MNPQENMQANAGTQPQQDLNAQNSDGFGGSTIGYANYNDQIVQQQAQLQDPGAVPMNVVDIVNANGVVSGKKVVDYIWQRIAVCMIVLAAGLLIGLVAVLMIAIACESRLPIMTSGSEHGPYILIINGTGESVLFDTA